MAVCKKQADLSFAKQYFIIYVEPGSKFKFWEEDNRKIEHSYIIWIYFGLEKDKPKSLFFERNCYLLSL